jgi:predicted metal-dependent hydrolase
MQLSLFFDPISFRNENQNQPNLQNQNLQNQNLQNPNPQNQNLQYPNPKNQNPKNQNPQNENQNRQNLKNPNPQNQNQNQNPERRTPNPELVFLRHPRARRYVLRVTDAGIVRVTLPRWGSRRDAQEFARSQQAWIDRQLRKVAAERERPRPPGLSREELRALVGRAKSELPTRLLELAAVHGLTVTRISIRNQRWRWGSCNRHGHICLNWRLVTMPEWVRDYVLIHELMHLKRMDHSPAFWKLVAVACPRYQDARRWLRQQPRA